METVFSENLTSSSFFLFSSNNQHQYDHLFYQQQHQTHHIISLIMINVISMITLRLEVGSFELELRQVDVAGDAPGLEGELLTAVNELGTGAGGFHLVVVDMVHRAIVDMIIVENATSTIN